MGLGAAGIFSRVPPYSDTVTDGETGGLVDNTVPAWRAALERLVSDEPYRTPSLQSRRHFGRARLTGRAKDWQAAILSTEQATDGGHLTWTAAGAAGGPTVKPAPDLANSKRDRT
jgi:hypothetical protein